MERRRGSLRAVLRFLAGVLMVSGALLVLDAAATLVWQEPVSWEIASGLGRAAPAVRGSISLALVMALVFFIESRDASGLKVGREGAVIERPRLTVALPA